MFGIYDNYDYGFLGKVFTTRELAELYIQIMFPDNDNGYDRGAYSYSVVEFPVDPNPFEQKAELEQAQIDWEFRHVQFEADRVKREALEDQGLADWERELLGIENI